MPLCQNAIDNLLLSESNGSHIPHVIFVVPTAEYELIGSLAEGHLVIKRREEPKKERAQ